MQRPNLKNFDYVHLPERLRAISKPFHDLAHDMYERLPENEQTAMMLWKLLEAKDCAVRAFIG